jgi:hypothetical protein
MTATNRRHKPACVSAAAGLAALALSAVAVTTYAQATGRPIAQATGSTPIVTPTQELRMSMTIGNRRYALTLANTDAARAFAARLPLTLNMSDLNDNEKKVAVSPALPAAASRPGTIRNGDVMLYGDSTLVVFYRTFESMYSYTRIGKLDAPEDLEKVLGPQDVKVTFSRE